MTKKRTSKKNCQETTCGFTCISTEKVCHVDSPNSSGKPKRLKRSVEKILNLNQLISNSIKDRTHPLYKSPLEKVNELRPLISHINEKSQKLILSSAENLHILNLLVNEQDKNSTKRQWITHEEKAQVLDWYYKGQKTVPLKPVSEKQLDALWQQLKETDKSAATKLKSKGSPQYRFDSELKPDVRGRFILGMYLATGKKDTVTGKVRNWLDLEPDHKDPKKGDTLENMMLVYRPINRHKGKKTWEEYVKSLEKYDPDVAEKNARKSGASEASMIIQYRERLISGEIRDLFKSKTVPDEFNSQRRQKGLLKLLSTNPRGTYAIVTQPNKRTSTGTVASSYPIIQYRLGIIPFEAIPNSVWQEYSAHSSKSVDEIKTSVKSTFNPEYGDNISPRFSTSFTTQASQLGN